MQRDSVCEQPRVVSPGILPSFPSWSVAVSLSEPFPDS